VTSAQATLKITTSVCTFQNFKTSSSTTLQYLCPKRTPRGDGTLVPSAIHLDFLTSLAFRRCNNDKLGKLNIPPPDHCCRQIPENDLELWFSEDLGNSCGKSTNDLYFWKSALQTRMVFVSASRTGAVYLHCKPITPPQLPAVRGQQRCPHPILYRVPAKSILLTPSFR